LYLFLGQSLIRFAGIPPKEFDESLSPEVSQVVCFQSDESQGESGSFDNYGFPVFQYKSVRAIKTNPGGVSIVFHLFKFQNCCVWDN
jgi:hypothetical protein